VGGNFLIDASTGRGAPAVADFDGDDQPEIAAPDGFTISLFDLDCPTAGPGCEGDFVRWSSQIQDASSGRSMASAFDFEADGRDEVVFADECFARIYDGLSGEILGSSPRSSCTFAEGVSIADTNGDGAAELLVGSNSNCSVPCPAIDPVHAGLRCQDSSDCLSGSCVAGLCRCADSGQCQADYACSPPLEGADGNTCRAAHPGGSIQGVRVVRDAEARWGATLDIWNQHSYTVTNVDSCGRIPATSDWIPNHTDPRRNDHRTADSICRP
jgi:hypothetical protein